MFDYIRNLNKEFATFQDNCYEAKRRCEDKNSNENNFTALEKENKFMGENIKRLSAEKMKAEKKVMDS